MAKKVAVYEAELVRALKDFLFVAEPGAAKWVWAHKNVGGGGNDPNGLYGYEKAKAAGYAPLQVPTQEIDLLFLNEKYQLFCIEVKFFRELRDGGEHPLLPYYSGLEQALALGAHGFPAVFLWQFFLEDTPLKIARVYRQQQAALISNLSLPVNYRAFVVTDLDKGQFKNVLSDKLLKPGQIAGMVRDRKWDNPQSKLAQCKIVYGWWREHLSLGPG